MKKATLILISILLAVFAFVSCNHSVDYVFDKEPDPGVRGIPLTLEFLAEGELKITTEGEYGPCDVYYSLNGGEKTLFEVGTPVSVSKDDVVSLYRDVSGAKLSYPHFTVNCTSDCHVYGNVMSLIDSDDFATAEEVYARSFMRLFAGNEHISNHPTIDIILPATTLAEGCYNGMFIGCTKLERAPELPATQLAEGCYAFMFADCTSLERAPELPAETLTNHCYSFMFSGCTGLKKSSVLPAETLADYCYSHMFDGCTSLNHIICLATDFTADGCIEGWVDDVAAAGTFMKNPNADSWKPATYGIPTTWAVTVYETTPLTLEVMNNGVLNLTITKWGNPGTVYYSHNGGKPEVIYNVASINVRANDKITLYRDLGSTELAANNYFSISCNIPCKVYGNVMSLIKAEGFEELIEVPKYAFYSLFYVINTTIRSDASKDLVLPATTLGEGCYRDMFRNCNNLTKAPDLPALKLCNWCYLDMFHGCDQLGSLTCLATDISADLCVLDWLDDAGASVDTKTFYKNPSVSEDVWHTGKVPLTWDIEDAP